MPKVVASLPKHLMKNSVIGALLALFCYILLQFLGALLIHTEVVGEAMIYPMVCLSAGIASFLGCGYSVLRESSGSVLSSSTVVAVFLTLTAAVGLLAGGAEMIGAGLTGIGGAMAVGGLLAAVVPGVWNKREKRPSERGRSKTKGRQRR